jgi:hypothetical protein
MRKKLPKLFLNFLVVLVLLLATFPTNIFAVEDVAKTITEPYVYNVTSAQSLFLWDKGFRVYV